MPSWDVLYEIAAAQRGYFTARQARDAGYSSALLRHYVRTRQDQRVRHGIYRLAKFPASEHEELMVEWLWTGGVGVFSHETVLSLHELSDVLPTQFHLTVPTAWRHRRLTIPDGVELHYADLPTADRAWFGEFPTTTIRRTLDDAASDGTRPDLIIQAVEQAVARGLVALEELTTARELVATYRSGR
jgi:predicted transcriptional regulator of viral defense system